MFVTAQQAAETSDTSCLFQDLPEKIEREILNEKSFKRAIALERVRTERSNEPFLLMLVNTGANSENPNDDKVEDSLLSVLMTASRESDVIGWYSDRTTVGVMFTGMIVKDKNYILSTIMSRFSSLLHDELTFEEFDRISLSFHFFPEDLDRYDRMPPSGNNRRSGSKDSRCPSESALFLRRGVSAARNCWTAMTTVPIRTRRVHAEG